MSATLSIGEHNGSLDLIWEWESITKAVSKSMVRAGIRVDSVIGGERQGNFHFHDVHGHFCTTELETFSFAVGSTCIGSTTRFVALIGDDSASKRRLSLRHGARKLQY